ncbi:hypothetical protein C7A07_01275 [Pseudomonas fragi]|nr:hypothetical protein C7A07_01275 [Pseudomonas fragi]
MTTASCWKTPPRKTSLPRPKTCAPRRFCVRCFKAGPTCFCGSGLARDTGAAVCQDSRVDPIASKPAPTGAGG